MEAPAAFSERTGLHPITVPTPFVVGPVNAFLWMGEPLTLIDAGTRLDDSEAALRAGLAALGVSFKDIQRILLSHHHLDHTGLSGRIQAESGAEVWGHPELEQQMALSHAHDDAQRQFFMDLMRNFGVPADMAEQSMMLWDLFKSFVDDFRVDRTFTDGGMAGPFRTWFVPGHSATDTLFQHEAAGYSIVADHLLESINPNPLLRRPAPGEPRKKALVEYQASLRRSRALELGRCFPGHGAFFDDHRRVADGILGLHEKRNARVLELAGASEITPYALARSLFPDLQIQHLYLALSVACGHLELLEDRGAMTLDADGGVLRYRAA